MVSSTSNCLYGHANQAKDLYENRKNMKLKKVALLVLANALFRSLKISPVKTVEKWPLKMILENIFVWTFKQSSKPNKVEHICFRNLLENILTVILSLYWGILGEK